MEYKYLPAMAIKANEAEGVVESLIAVHGVIDEGNDRSWPGAFSEATSGGGPKVRCLDAHRKESIKDVIGAPLALRELRQNELPQQLLAEYPEASGALWTRTRFLMEDEAGKAAYQRVAAGVSGWSYGYDAVKTDYSTVQTKSGSKKVRNLRAVRLYEYSVVPFPMNQATLTLSTKSLAALRFARPRFDVAAVKELRQLLTEVEVAEIDALTAKGHALERPESRQRMNRRRQLWQLARDLWRTGQDPDIVRFGR